MKNSILRPFLACFFSIWAMSAEIQIIIGDAPGVGLNDTTPATPVAGNPGTTLGEQRLNVVARAVEIWAANLESDVPIVIRAIMSVQFCDATSAVLASAGANVINRDFANAPLPGTWYHAALANAIAASDLDPASHDINVTINISLDDDPVCLGGNGWYYGFDHNEGDKADLLAVLLHEYAHGLGFANFVNETNGLLFNGFPDVYTTYTKDLETGMDWNDMTNAQRIASAINDPDVVWTGTNVTDAVPNFLNHTSKLIVNAPGGIAGIYPAQAAAFGPLVPSEGVTGEVVLVDDPTPPSSDGCEAPFNNAGALNGKIALIDRGTCTFVAKVLNAQAAGAIAVLIANNAPDVLPPMGGADPTVTIPSYGITQALGQAIQNELPGVNVTLGYSPTELAGVNDGFLRLNAPDPVSSGSSISHWTPDAEPSLLMEPNITPDLTDDVDLTLEHFKDIGWTLIPSCITATFSSSPGSETACVGDNVIFSVSAEGTDLSYQWQKAGEDLMGETNPTLELTNVQTSDEGLYTCIIQNDCTDPLTSSVAVLTVESPTFESVLAMWPLNSSLHCEDLSGNGRIDVLDLIGLMP